MDKLNDSSEKDSNNLLKINDQEYFETRSDISSEISIDIIEKNNPLDSKLQNDFQNKLNKVIIDKINHKEAQLEAFSESFYKLFEMYRFNKSKNYFSSLEKGKNIILDFLRNLYKYYIQNSKKTVPELGNINLFLDYLIKSELLPFSKKDLQNHLRKAKEYASEQGNIEKQANDLYNLMSDFQNRLYSFQVS